jgi:HD superfamily phosphohydrolase YqeK
MADKFLQLIKEKATRDGVNELIKWIESTDFFVAPASTRFHGNYRGGLVEHSINVYENLVKLNALYGLCQDEETLAIVSLLHDVCKVDMYKEDFRNVKNDNGVWEKVPCYTHDEKFAYGGHGSKSVFLVQKHMRLTDEEAVCINAHMGAFDRPTGDYSLTAAYEMYPLALLLHTADMIATYIDEKGPEEKEAKLTSNPIDGLLKEILSICKGISDSGGDKDSMYDIIAKNNNGKKNPNSIKDVANAKKIIEELRNKFNG